MSSTFVFTVPQDDGAIATHRFYAPSDRGSAHLDRSCAWQLPRWRKKLGAELIRTNRGVGYVVEKAS
ncbi:hypothetical protein [Burkholderia pyrrocinia]|uniref:hypothetical protein n=1 Tax=Burkholderia pyrrocinia TaxID=60550 RepID=UPI001F22B060|nr:hypothetical protein [Burkholderia pyrrocinia]